METILAVTLIAAVLVGMSFYLHYKALKLCARAVIGGKMQVRMPLLVVLAMVFLVHLAEVMLFALAYYLMHWSEWLGTLIGGRGANMAEFERYFYFSISSYTTLGMGDIIPSGAIRIIAGVEALSGLMLIAWSASFSYLMMETLWEGDATS